VCDTRINARVSVLCACHQPDLHILAQAITDECTPLDPAAGGIMKCDVIASGIVNAAKGVGIEVPLIVRLEGTNVERGKEILKTSGLDIIAASDLDDAAHRAVGALSSK
jgi:CoA-ligase